MQWNGTVIRSCRYGRTKSARTVGDGSDIIVVVNIDGVVDKVITPCWWAVEIGVTSAPAIPAPAVIPAVVPTIIPAPIVAPAVPAKSYTETWSKCIGIIAEIPGIVTIPAVPAIVPIPTIPAVETPGRVVNQYGCTTKREGIVVECINIDWVEVTKAIIRAVETTNP